MRLLFGERLILSDVYLKIETGDAIGLLGRNGAGKSCLMRGAYGTLKCEKSVIKHKVACLINKLIDLQGFFNKIVVRFSFINIFALC